MSQWNSALFNCFYKTVEYSNDGTSGCEFYMFVAMASYYGKGQNTVWVHLRHNSSFRSLNLGSKSIFNLQISDLIFWSTRPSWALDLMRVLDAQQLWQIRPVFQCLNDNFYFQQQHLNLQPLSIWIICLTPALRMKTSLCFCHTCEESHCLCFGEVRVKKTNYSLPSHCNRDTGISGGSTVYPGSGWALWLPTSKACKHVFKFKHVRCKWNYLHLKIKYMFHRSGQMVLHAQKWHLQGHIWSVWQSQELKLDLPSDSLVP